MKIMESTLVNMVCVLVGVALIMGGILAYVNHMTEGPISLQAEKALSDGIKAVMMSDNLTITANDTVRETIDNKECVFIVCVLRLFRADLCHHPEQRDEHRLVCVFRLFRVDLRYDPVRRDEDRW